MNATAHTPGLEPGYTPAPIHPALLSLHWLMAFLFVLALGSLLVRSGMPTGHAWRPMLRNVHLQCGQLILLTAVLRVVVRWRHPPQAMAGVPRWAARMGHGAHALLYGVMFIQPLSAIVFMQAGDKTVHFFGWALPRVVGSDIALQADFKAFHQLLGNALYGLLALHIAAALWHHHRLRNQTLRRMLGLRSPAVKAAPLHLAPLAAHTAAAPPKELGLSGPQQGRKAPQDAEAID